MAALAALILIGFPLSAGAQSIPALDEISVPVATAHPQLAARHAALMQAREALRARAMAQRAQCGSVEEGSAAASACAASRDALVAEIRQHVADSVAFNAEAGPYQCAAGTQFAAATDRCQAPAADRSPSLPTNLDAFSRSRFEAELADLKSRRLIAERELAKVSQASGLIEGGTLVNWQIRQDLTADSMVNALNTAEGLLSVYGPRLSPQILESAKVALAAAQASAHAYAAAQSEPESQRQFEQAREAMLDLSNLLSEAAVGMKSDAVAGVTRFRTAFNELAPAAKNLADDPSDQHRVAAMATALSDVVDAGERVPLAGALVAGVNGPAKLADTAVTSWWWLKRDAADLAQAGSVNQTARLYWQNRLGEIESMEGVYRASLGAGAN
jgi:hypothetical protein